MAKVTNNTDRRLTLAGVEVEPGKTVDMDESQISPSMGEMEKGGALTIGKAKAKKSDDKKSD